MKFGKEFSSQMVQEWQGAYMDYSHLKKHLKALLKSRQQSNNNPGFKRRRQAMYRAFSGLTGRSSPKAREEEAVMIPHSAYQALLMKLSAEGAEQELEFFKKLDLEFDKVRTFHEGKVQGIQENAVELSKQMDALIALRIGVERPDHVQETVAAGVVLSPAARSPEGEHMDVIQEVEMDEAEEKTKILEGSRPARLQVLEHVKINVDPDTPVSTLKNVVMSSKMKLSFSKDELRRAEKKMRKAFIEFHQQLRLLKSYR